MPFDEQREDDDGHGGDDAHEDLDGFAEAAVLSFFMTAEVDGKCGACALPYAIAEMIKAFFIMASDRGQPEDWAMDMIEAAAHKGRAEAREWIAKYDADEAEG